MLSILESVEKTGMEKMIKPRQELRGEYRWVQGLKDLINYNENIKGSMLEIGSYIGESTYIFLESKKFNSITCLDMWAAGYDNNDSSSSKMDGVEEEFDSLAKTSNGIIKKVKNSSEFITELFEDNSFDFIYIDGNHTYEWVKQDIQKSLPKLKSGGFIAGHDYNWSGVKAAIDETIGDVDCSFQDTSWIKKINF
jgi:predicted O-methyltransferase YrrM